MCTSSLLDTWKLAVLAFTSQRDCYKHWPVVTDGFLILCLAATEKWCTQLLVPLKKKVHSSLVWMGVQFWPSVSFTYYNESLAYANYKSEPSPGTSKRCWMMLCRCWLALAVLWKPAPASNSSLGWLAPNLVPGEVCISLCGKDCWMQVWMQVEAFWGKARCRRAKQRRFLGTSHNWQPSVICKGSRSKMAGDLQQCLVHSARRYY